METLCVCASKKVGIFPVLCLNTSIYSDIYLTQILMDETNSIHTNMAIEQNSFCGDMMPVHLSPIHAHT